MTQSLIRDFKQNWNPDFTGASKHVSLVIKEYSQLDKLVFHKQLDSTLRGLVVSGFNKYGALQIIVDELILGGFNIEEWINGRTASEIIANN
ncbi:hypothetical protein BC6_00013 [Bacillus phage BC-6]|nr:hypothetical protein BC6_00013 [Bacillus phage BC-6]